MLTERNIFVERTAGRETPTPSSPTSQELLNLFLSLTPQQRQLRFADTSRAAQITGLTQRTIQMWIEFGSIDAVHVGRKYQIDLESLRNYLVSRVGE